MDGAVAADAGAMAGATEEERVVGVSSRTRSAYWVMPRACRRHSMAGWVPLMNMSERSLGQ